MSNANVPDERENEPRQSRPVGGWISGGSRQILLGGPRRGQFFTRGAKKRQKIIFKDYNYKLDVLKNYQTFNLRVYNFTILYFSVKLS